MANRLRTPALMHGRPLKSRTRRIAPPRPHSDRLVRLFLVDRPDPEKPGFFLHYAHRLLENHHEERNRRDRPSRGGLCPHASRPGRKLSPLAR